MLHIRDAAYAVSLAGKSWQDQYVHIRQSGVSHQHLERINSETSTWTQG